MLKFKNCAENVTMETQPGSIALNIMFNCDKRKKKKNQSKQKLQCNNYAKINAYFLLDFK